MKRESLVAQDIATFISTFSFDDIPENVLAQAKKCLLDSVACMLGGLGTDVGQITLDVIRQLDGALQSSVIGTEHKTSRTLAAFANSTTVNALDFDDTYYGHPGATVTPPAISSAEFLRSAGKDLLASIVAGYETSIRIGRAINPSLKRARKVKGLATWQVFGALSAIGKLRKLDSDLMAKAIGIAGAYAPVPAVIKICSHNSFPATMVKNAFGPAAFSADLAVEFAKHGFTGPVDIFDGDEGFWRIAGSDQCDFDLFTEGLGKNFTILDVAFKPYSCCRYIHAALDACLALQEEHSVNPRDIERIQVRSLSRLTEWKPFDINDPPKSMVEAQFCPAYDIAVALFGIPPGPQWFTPNSLNNPEILKLASKIEIQPDEESDKISHEEHRLTATAYMETSKGDYERKIKSARGEKDNPITQNWIENKFRSLASSVLGKDRSENAIRIINTIEEIDDVNHLIKQLSPTL